VNTFNVADQPFTRKITATTSQAGGNAWDAGYGITNKQAIQQGDNVSLTFYMKSGTTEEGNVNFFVENGTTFAKEVYLGMATQQEWTRYFVRFEASQTYAPNALSIGFHLATQAQTVEIGGWTGINFGGDVFINELPSDTGGQFYGGYEEDAPWRAVAADNIETYRKADVTITTRMNDGTPVENALVNLEMVRHNFAWGSAIKASLIADNPEFNIIYESKLKNLDGEGHGFNTVVFENDMKWDGWEEEWFVNKTELVSAVQWLKNNDITLRGHNLIWPGSQYLPNDIVPNLNDLEYVRNRMYGHIEEILTWPGIEGEVSDWDVLNEVVANTTIANAWQGEPGYPTGREIYQDIFNKAREVDANTGLWLNDYVTISLNNQAGTNNYDQLKQYTGELVDAGVDIEGIGFQAHVSGVPTGIPDVIGTISDFTESFNIKAKITEFDMPSSIEEELGATYLVDFMTAVFGHPDVDGFLFWNFWDGATWLNGGTNLYNLDWSETLSHEAFTNQLFNEWWTDQNFVTNADGNAAHRVFKGDYIVTFECNGETIQQEINISDTEDILLICDDFTLTDVQEIDTPQLSVYPNPSQGQFHIERPTAHVAQLNVYDVNGKLLISSVSTSQNEVLDLGAYNGVLILEIQDGEHVYQERLIVE